MLAGWDIEFLEEIGLISEDDDSKPGSFARFKIRKEDPALTASSPAILEPSKDSFRFVGRMKTKFLFRKIQSRSLPVLPETVPIISGGHSIDADNGQQMDEQKEEGSANCFTTVINFYRNSAIRFRNSVFMYIVELLFSLIPISAIGMGLLFAERCPQVHFLPVFGTVIGAIGVILIAFWMVVTCNNLQGTPCSNRQIFLFGVLFFLYSVLTIVDMAFVISLSPSYDPISTDYCHKTFYTYAFFKESATAVVVILSVIIYLPGSRHILCCHDCSMSSLPSAFYCSI